MYMEQKKSLKIISLTEKKTNFNKKPKNLSFINTAGGYVFVVVVF